MFTSQVAEFKNIALRAYPNEAGAVIIGDTLYPVPNVSPTPLDAMEFSGAHLTQLELKYGRIEAILHSHIVNPTVRDTRRDPRWASSQDLRMWFGLNIPFGIVAVDGENVTDPLWYDDANRAPLLGRTFSHGLHDCYGIIRDYYHLELGINIPNYVRSWDWWNNGEDLYSQNFGDAGFIEVPLETARNHDVLLYAIGTRVINHAAVFLAPNGIIHHLIDRQSRVDVRSKWQRAEVKCVRHHSLLGAS